MRACKDKEPVMVVFQNYLRAIPGISRPEEVYLRINRFIVKFSSRFRFANDEVKRETRRLVNHFRTVLIRRYKLEACRSDATKIACCFNYGIPRTNLES